MGIANFRTAQLELGMARTPPGSGRAGAYRIAGRAVLVRPALEELAAFEGPPGSRGRPAPEPVPPAGAPPRSATVYRGPAWLAGAERQVRCRRHRGGLRVTIEGVGVVDVAEDGSRARVRGEAGAPRGHLVEAVLGPGLVLPLALQGTFCLHASAVAAPGGGLTAFLGASGAGKSTLARLAGQAGTVLRAADDVLPVEVVDGEARARPRFPQLKLAPAAQPGARVPDELPLRRLFLLASGGGEAVRVRRLSPGEAVLALVRHTVAARLFGTEVLARHLELCAALAEAVPVAELSYPWSDGLDPELARIVAGGEEAA